MSALSIKIEANIQPLKDALLSLENISKTSPEIFHRFFCGLDSLSQLVRIDRDRSTAARAGEHWVVFQPSDLLVEFLLATGTGERDVL